MITVENSTHRVTIERDPHPTNPREWDNLCTIIWRHKGYSLGEIEAQGNLGGWKEELDYVVGDKDIIVKPIYMFDHSGLTISTTPFRNHWDSGQVGWIFATWEDIASCYQLDEDLSYDNGDGEVINEYKDKARKVLKHEVNTLDKYLRGDVYRFNLEEKDHCEHCQHTHYESIDSCSGFYEIEAILEHLPEEITEKVKEEI